jgi:hypothetical protein
LIVNGTKFKGKEERLNRMNRMEMEKQGGGTEEDRGMNGRKRKLWGRS